MANDISRRRFPDADGDAHRATFDPGTEPISDAVVRVVASVTGNEPSAIEPIEAVVDPIIFDALVRRQRRDMQISFRYHDQQVTVDSSGHIIVQQCRADGGAGQRFQFGDSDSACDAVVRAIAAMKGIDEMEVEPLYNHIDTDALDKILDGANESNPVVSFQFDGLQIAVSGDNSVVVSRE